MKAIRTTYLGPTNTKGSRVKATDGDRNSVIISWDYNLNTEENHQAAAKFLCDKMNWQGEMIMGGFLDYNVHVFVNRNYAAENHVRRVLRKAV